MTAHPEMSDDLPSLSHWLESQLVDRLAMLAKLADRDLASELDAAVRGHLERVLRAAQDAPSE